MALTVKKFLDINGVKQLVGLLDDYPSNEVLATVINSIQDELDTKSTIGTASSGDLEISDESGNVLARFENGHIKTQNFNSENIEQPLEHYKTDMTPFVRGQVNTFTITHSFKKGQHIVFHVEDETSKSDWGHFGDYYEGNNLIIAERRGVNGYFEHIITQNCEEVSVKFSGAEYVNDTDIRLHVYIINGEIKPHIVTVSSDGSKMFTTLKAAVESITDANSVTNPYVIEVYSGVYNTLEGYTTEQIQSADTSGTGYTQDTFVGLKLTDGISIRGVGNNRESIILTAELSTSDYSSNARGNISTLNLQGSSFVENITIARKNLRYCVHDDFQEPTNSNSWRRLTNVLFIGDNLAYSPQFTTYGAGMSIPRNYLIENCDFGYDLGIHSNNNYRYGCKIEVNNCTGHRFRIGDNAQAETEFPVEVYVNNCNFDIIRVVRPNTSISPHIILRGTGGEHALVIVPSDQIYQLGMVDKTLPQFQKGTLVARVSGNYNFTQTSDLNIACGVVVGANSGYSYIQREGYVASNILGLSGLALGDSITVDSNNMLVSGGSAGNRVGVVKAVDENGIAYIHLWH